MVQVTDALSYYRTIYPSTGPLPRITDRLKEVSGRGVPAKLLCSPPTESTDARGILYSKMNLLCSQSGQEGWCGLMCSM